MMSETSGSKSFDGNHELESYEEQEVSNATGTPSIMTEDEANLTSTSTKLKIEETS